MTSARERLGDPSWSRNLPRLLSAYDAVAGIATGLAMRSARDLSTVQQEGIFDVVKDWPAVGPPFALSIVGTLGWVAAVGALALQLAAKARWQLSCWAGTCWHPFPAGTLAFGCLFVAALLHEFGGGGSSTLYTVRPRHAVERANPEVGFGGRHTSAAAECGKRCGGDRSRRPEGARCTSRCIIRPRLQNLCGVVAPRSVGSTPAPLRQRDSQSSCGNCWRPGRLGRHARLTRSHPLETAWRRRCEAFDSFVNQVDAQDGKGLYDWQALYLSYNAQRIQALIGC